MEHVVYLLGAGFSAPLGLPTVSDFYFRSQEMYALDRDRYAHFAKVFSTIRTLSVSKNYYSANMFNIEDILSILEMTEHLNGRRLKGPFIQYIRDVIAYTTPALQPCKSGEMPGNWHDWLFGTNSDWHDYGSFVMSLFGAQFQYAAGNSGIRAHSDIAYHPGTFSSVKYSVLTLNYDTVLESLSNFVATNYVGDMMPEFQRTPDDDNNSASRTAVALAKLHGCASTGDIVPPTWNKHLSRAIVPAWRLAYAALASATQIRVIGYSLPTADAYLKYLLKAAITEDPVLKRIDIVCLDQDGSVKKRYDEFIQFGYYTFHNRDTRSYLSAVSKVYQQNPLQPGSRRMIFDRLERAHSAFVRE